MVARATNPGHSPLLPVPLALSFRAPFSPAHFACRSSDYSRLPSPSSHPSPLKIWPHRLCWFLRKVSFHLQSQDHIQHWMRASPFLEQINLHFFQFCFPDHHSSSQEIRELYTLPKISLPSSWTCMHRHRCICIHTHTWYNINSSHCTF